MVRVLSCDFVDRLAGLERTIHEITRNLAKEHEGNLLMSYVLEGSEVALQFLRNGGIAHLLFLMPAKLLKL